MLLEIPSEFCMEGYGVVAGESAEHFAYEWEVGVLAAGAVDGDVHFG